MRIIIKQKNLEVTPSLRKYIDDKIVKPVEKLTKRLAEGLSILELEFSRDTRHHKKGKVFYAEANLTLGGKLIRAEALDINIRAACDVLKDELESRIKKFKTKSSTISVKRARFAKNELRYDPASGFNLRRDSAQKN